MRRIIAAVTLGLFAVVSGSPANAADLPQKVHRQGPAFQPFSPASFTWQGFYLGLNGGYGWGSSTLTGTGGSSTIHPSGFIGGSTAGYNFQFSNVVIGIEGDLDYSWMRATNGATAPCPNCEVRNFYLGTVRGRLGYAWGRWLPYVTGGVAFGDIQTSTPLAGSQTVDKTGWTLGGGVEYAFAGPWSTKLEYQYVDLGTATCDAAHCGIAVDTNFHASTVRMGINYRY